MEQLREDYKSGDRFFPEDMNQVTHTINEVSNPIKIVSQLPRTGEDGVLYAVRNGTIFLYATFLNNSGYIKTGGFVEVEDSITYAVGDIIQINSGGTIQEGTIFATEVDPENLAYVYGTEYEYIDGVVSYLNLIAGHRYRITGIFNVVDISPEEKFYNYKLHVYTFEDVTEQLLRYNFEFNALPSLQIVANEPYKMKYNLPIVTWNDGWTDEFVMIGNIEVLYEEGVLEKLLFFDDILHVGTILKATTNNKITFEGDLIDCTLISDVDDSEFECFDDSDDAGFSGITWHIEWQKDHYYRIKDTREFGEMLNRKGIYLYEEITDPQTVDYEVPLLPGGYTKIYEGKILNSYNTYYWDDGVYQQIVGSD